VKIPSVKRITDTPPKLHEAQAMVGGLVEIVQVGDDKQLLIHPPLLVLRVALVVCRLCV
jgi:hypothetical protein